MATQVESSMPSSVPVPLTAPLSSALPMVTAPQPQAQSHQIEPNKTVSPPAASSMANEAPQSHPQAENAPPPPTTEPKAPEVDSSSTNMPKTTPEPPLSKNDSESTTGGTVAPTSQFAAPAPTLSMTAPMVVPNASGQVNKVPIAALAPIVSQQAKQAPLAHSHPTKNGMSAASKQAATLKQSPIKSQVAIAAKPQSDAPPIASIQPNIHATSGAKVTQKALKQQQQQLQHQQQQLQAMAAQQHQQHHQQQQQQARTILLNNTAAFMPNTQFISKGATTATSTPIIMSTNQIQMIATNGAQPQQYFQFVPIATTASRQPQFILQSAGNGAQANGATTTSGQPLIIQTMSNGEQQQGQQSTHQFINVLQANQAAYQSQQAQQFRSINATGAQLMNINGAMMQPALINYSTGQAQLIQPQAANMQTALPLAQVNPSASAGQLASSPTAAKPMKVPVAAVAAQQAQVPVLLKSDAKVVQPLVPKHSNASNGNMAKSPNLKLQQQHQSHSPTLTAVASKSQPQHNSTSTGSVSSTPSSTASSPTSSAAVSPTQSPANRLNGAHCTSASNLAMAMCTADENTGKVALKRHNTDVGLHNGKSTDGTTAAKKLNKAKGANNVDDKMDVNSFT